MSKEHTAHDCIKRIAEAARGFGWGSGTSAQEFAGQIVSILYAHPDKIQEFMDGEGTVDFPYLIDTANGSLTYLTQKGELWSPGALRQHMIETKNPRADELLPLPSALP